MRKQLVEKIFYTIDQLISGAEITFSRASLSQKLKQIDVLQDSGEYDLTRALKRFENQGLMESMNRKGQIYYALTNKGGKRLASLRFKRTLQSGIKWDGYWRLVIFDIPEDKKIIREGLRRKLKYYSFYPLQKSVFVFPFDCRQEMEDLAKFFNIEDNLLVLVVKSLGRREKEIRQYYRSAIKK